MDSKINEITLEYLLYHSEPEMAFDIVGQIKYNGTIQGYLIVNNPHKLGEELFKYFNNRTMGNASRVKLRLRDSLMVASRDDVIEIIKQNSSNCRYKVQGDKLFVDGHKVYHSISDIESYEICGSNYTGIESVKIKTPLEIKLLKGIDETVVGNVYIQPNVYGTDIKYGSLGSDKATHINVNWGKRLGDLTDINNHNKYLGHIDKAKKRVVVSKCIEHFSDGVKDRIYAEISKSVAIVRIENIIELGYTEGAIYYRKDGRVESKISGTRIGYTVRNMSNGVLQLGNLQVNRNECVNITQDELDENKGLGDKPCMTIKKEGKIGKLVVWTHTNKCCKGIKDIGIPSTDRLLAKIEAKAKCRLEHRVITTDSLNKYIEENNIPISCEKDIEEVRDYILDNAVLQNGRVVVSDKSKNIVNYCIKDEAVTLEMARKYIEEHSIPVCCEKDIEDVRKLMASNARILFDSIVVDEFRPNKDDSNIQSRVEKLMSMDEKDLAKGITESTKDKSMLGKILSRFKR